jgi:hypothetical protein
MAPGPHYIDRPADPAGSQGDPVPFLVRLRPNTQYLGLLLIAALLTVTGVGIDGVFRVVLVTCGGVLLVLLGVPVLLSTVLRVPTVAIDEEGIRLPLMGVRLTWTQIEMVRRTTRADIPVLLVVPTAPDDVLRQARPWLRTELRRNVIRYGTPIVVPGPSSDHTVDDILTAVAARRPAPTP